MADKTGIEWTDATVIVDRNGRRVRYYKRVDPSRPGQQLRRQMASRGLKWCRDCSEWSSASEVTKNGLCRKHERANYRAYYANNRDEMCAVKVARNRGIEPMPAEARECIAEQFDGLCGYCGAAYEAWDHAVPVSKGGRTEPGNMVPACTKCNSSKKDMDLDVWLETKAPAPLPYTIEYLTFAGVLQ